MTVEENKQVSIEYTLKLDDGKEVDSNLKSDPLVFVHGSGLIIPGLEKELLGMKAGESKQVVVSPEDGYGESNPKALVRVDINKIPDEARKVGAMLQGQSAEGGSVYARVSEVSETTVTLDHNHPLAGKTLHFDVKVLNVSDAPETEAGSCSTSCDSSSNSGGDSGCASGCNSGCGS